MYSTVKTYKGKRYNVTIERVNNDRNGTPRFSVRVYQEHGNTLYGLIFDKVISSYELSEHRINEYARQIIIQAIQYNK